MRASRVLVASVFWALLLCQAAGAQQQVSTYWTTDESTSHLAPSGGWGGSPMTGSFPTNQTIWFSAPNAERDRHYKFWALQLTVTPNQAVSYFTPDGTDAAEAFRSLLDDSDPVNEVIQIGGLLNTNTGVDEQYFRIYPCSEWERIRYVVTIPMDDVSIAMRSVTMCSDAENEAIELHLDDTSIAAPGATSGTAPTREVWVFPSATPVDPVGNHSFSTPGWTPEYVTVGPEGTSYPLGGVRFYTLAAGLTTADLFDARVVMIGASSPSYDVYLLDTDGQIDRVVVVPPSAAPVPAMSAWGEAVLAVALLGLAAAALRVGRAA